MKEKNLIENASVFIVPDVVASAEFYRDQLGFRFERYWGDPPVFCILWRDASAIMLQKLSDPGLEISPNHRINPGLWDAYFWVNDVEALAQEFSKNAVRFVYGPETKDYGIIELCIEDLNGYQLAFGQDIP